MSIDKFGRYSLNISKGGGGTNLRGPKGDGFHFTDNGDYDIQNKKLCNVGTATNDDDALTYKQFKTLSDVFEIKNNYVSLNKKKRIVSVNPSINKNDVVVRLELDSLSNDITNTLKNLNTTYIQLLSQIQDLNNKYSIINRELTDHKINMLDLKNQVGKWENEFKTTKAELVSAIATLNNAMINVVGK